MAEHFYAHKFAARTADILLYDGAVDGRHLVEVQLPREHHHIGPLRVETHGLGIADAQLRGDMHLHAHAAGVKDCRDVAGDDG